MCVCVCVCERAGVCVCARARAMVSTCLPKFAGEISAALELGDLDGLLGGQRGVGLRQASPAGDPGCCCPHLCQDFSKASFITSD